MATRLDSRFDFRGGWNPGYTPDSVDETELVTMRNARSWGFAGIRTRAGTQRIHTTALAGGAKINGLFQWFPTSGRQVVAIAGGNLYYQNEGEAEFTEVAANLETNDLIQFQPFVVAGSPVLYFADGTLRKWTGTTLSNVAGSPAAKHLAVYKRRMFASDGTENLYWSQVDNAENWTFPDGGEVPVETYDATPLVALKTVAASLLLFKSDSVARFTGVAAADMRVDQETEGVSADVGTVAPHSVVRMDNAVYFMSDRGPFMATEASVGSAGIKMDPIFDAVGGDAAAGAHAVYNRGAREVWTFLPGASGQNDSWVSLNTRTQAWYGPHDFMGTFNACTSSRFETSEGKENAILGGYDGFVRLGAVQTEESTDDMLPDGTGGTPIKMTLDFGDLHFRNVTQIKRLRGAQHFALDLGTRGRPQLTLSSDVHESKVTYLSTKGAGLKQYLVRPHVYGRRLGVKFEDESGQVVYFSGWQLSGETERRVV